MSPRFFVFSDTINLQVRGSLLRLLFLFIFLLSFFSVRVLNRNRYGAIWRQAGAIPGTYHCHSHVGGGLLVWVCVKKINSGIQPRGALAVTGGALTLVRSDRSWQA